MKEAVIVLKDVMDVFSHLKIGKGHSKPCQAGVSLSTTSILELPKHLLDGLLRDSLKAFDISKENATAATETGRLHLTQTENSPFFYCCGDVVSCVVKNNATVQNAFNWWDQHTFSGE